MLILDDMFFSFLLFYDLLPNHILVTQQFFSFFSLSLFLFIKFDDLRIILFAVKSIQQLFLDINIERVFCKIC